MWKNLENQSLQITTALRLLICQSLASSTEGTKMLTVLFFGWMTFKILGMKNLPFSF